MSRNKTRVKSESKESTINRREDEKIGEIKEKKHVLKQSSAQSAQDFLWAHFVAPLQIEEDLSLEENNTVIHGHDGHDGGGGSQRGSGGTSSTSSPNTPDLSRLSMSQTRRSTRGGGKRSTRRSTSSDTGIKTPSHGGTRLSSTASGAMKSKSDQASKVGRRDSLIRLKQRSPSPIPTPPPLPEPELIVRTIDGNYVKIGLRPHKGTDGHMGGYVEPFGHLAQIEAPDRIKDLKLHEVGPEAAYGPCEKEDIYRILRDKFPWFNLIDYDTQENVMDLMRARSYDRGQFIYKQGDDPDGMYFVEEGTVDLIHDKRSDSTEPRSADAQSEDKVSLLLASLGPEEFFGETECYYGQALLQPPTSPILRYASAQAGSETVRVLFLPTSAVIKYLLPNEKVMEGFAQHLELYKDQLLQLGIKDLGEILPKTKEKPVGQAKATAAEYLWGHFYEEIGAKEGKEGKKSQIPRPVDRGSEFLAHLFKLWMENRCCDSVIKLGHHRFPVHSLVLKLFCKSYESLTTPDDPKTLTLTGLTPKAVLETLYYLYTARIVLTTSNVEKVLGCGVALGIPSLVEMCKHFAEVYLEPDDVLKVSRSLQDMKSLSLDSRIRRLLATKFELIVAKEEFRELGPELVLKFLTHPDLRVEAEANVLSVLVDWINVDRGQRLPLAPKLIGQCVRFNEIPPGDILKLTLPNPHIFEGEECRALVLKAITYHAMHPGAAIKSADSSSRIRGVSGRKSSHGQDGTSSTKSTSGSKMSASFTRKKSSILSFSKDVKPGKATSRTSVPSSDSETDSREKERDAILERSELPAISSENAMVGSESFKRPRKSLKIVDAKDKDTPKSTEQMRNLSEIEKVDGQLNKKHGENLEILNRKEEENRKVLKTLTTDDKKGQTATSKPAPKAEASQENQLVKRLSQLRKVEKGPTADKNK